MAIVYAQIAGNRCKMTLDSIDLHLVTANLHVLLWHNKRQSL